MCIQGSNQDSGYTPAGVAVDSSCTLTVNGGEVWVTNDSNFDDPIAESPLASQPILNGGTLYLTSPSANGVCAYKPVTRDGCRWKVSVSTEAYSPLDYDPSYMTSLTDEEYNKLTDLSGYKTVCLEPLPAISSVGTVDAMATAKVTITEPGDYTLVFADYENGRLNGLNTVAFTVSAGLTGNRTITSTAAITLGTGDRVMLWKSLSGMKPICEAYTVK